MREGSPHLRVALATAALAFAVGLVALFALGPKNAAAIQTRPNILVIVSDDQPIGTTEGWMTNLSGWFKTQGTKFQWGFDTTPLCCPSRSSIFTGRYAHNHGVVTNDLGHQVFAPGAPANNTMLQYYLQQSGYKTGLFGKYLNQWDVSIPPPSFDDYAVYNNGAHFAPTPNPPTNPDCPNGYQAENGGGGLNCVGSPGGPPHAVLDKYETTFLAEKVQSFISQAHQANADQPWFLVVTPTVPHAPFTPEAKYETLPTPGFTDPTPGYFETDPGSLDFLSGKPPYAKNLQSVHGPCGILNSTTKADYKTCVLGHRDAMFRMLKSMDDLVGSIKQATIDANDEQDTLAFYISDNGYLWGQHWLEGKPYPYTESTRVPFLMRGPGVVPNFLDNTRLVGNIDIAPTAMQAASLSAPTAPPMDGRDLLSLPRFARNHILLERPGRQPPPNYPFPAGVQCGTHPVCGETGANNPPLWASVRTLVPGPTDPPLFGATRPYQYIETYGSTVAPYDPTTQKIYIQPGMAPTWSEFYNLGSDPLELTNTYGADAVYNSGETPNPADSPTGDPGLHTTLGRLLSCSGTSPALPNPCP
jgi:arylsulfatase A-like enzyme